MKLIYPTLNKETALFLNPQGGFIGKFGRVAMPLNKTASEILELCNGSNSQEYIVQSMASKYGENHEKVVQLIENFLSDAVRKEHIVLNPCQTILPGFIRGNREYNIPMDMTVEITAKCSLKCIHCYADSGPDKDALEKEKILNLLMKIRELGTVKVTLTGGDPLTHKYFLDILGYCCDNFLAVDVATNGYLIDEKIVKEISNLGRIGSLKFNISLDGTEFTHDQIRGVTGSWKRAIESIKLFSKYSIGVSVAMTLNPYNLRDMEEVIQTVKDSGAISFLAGITAETGRATGKNLQLTKEQTENAKEMMILAEKYATSNFSVTSQIGMSDHEVIEYRGEISCGAVSNFVHIDYLGNIRPCALINFSIGNVEKIDLVDIYKSQLPEIFPGIKRPSREVCGNCSDLYVCNGCIANALLRSDRTKDCSWKQHWDNFVQSSFPVT